MTHDEDLLHKRLKRLLKSSEDGKVEFKNYKDMCEKLKLPVKTSDSKKAQLKKLKYFCNLDTGEKKFSLIYTSVYPDPDSNILEEKFMVKSIETLLLASFLKQDAKPPFLILDTFSLWRLFGFINERYGIDREEQDFLKNNNISELHLQNFKRRTRRRFEDIITPALNQLSSRSLIFYHTIKIIRIKEGNDIITREATEEEIGRILDYEARALRKFKCEDINEIWAQSLEKEYYSYLNTLVRDKEEDNNWIKVSNGLKIVVNDSKWLQRGLTRNINELETKYNVNQEILALLQRNAETKFNNYMEQVDKEYECFKRVHTPFDKVKNRLPTYRKQHELMENDYIQSQEALMNYFVATMRTKIF